MGLPSELPKEQLALLLGRADLSAAVKADAAGPGRAASRHGPAGYYYDYEGNYWVDPATGIIVDTQKRETRTVGLDPDVLAGTPLAMLPEDQLAALRLPVIDFTYTATDASVEEAKADAEDGAGKLQLYGVILPIVGIALGAVLLVLGIVGMRRKTA